MLGGVLFLHGLHGFLLQEKAAAGTGLKTAEMPGWLFFLAECSAAGLNSLTKGSESPLRISMPCPYIRVP